MSGSREVSVLSFESGASVSPREESLIGLLRSLPGRYYCVPVRSGGTTIVRRCVDAFHTPNQENGAVR